ncbi:MAG: hypothetical protein AB1411_11880 [Nitrospirota bacterium]
MDSVALFQARTVQHGYPAPSASVVCYLVQFGADALAGFRTGCLPIEPLRMEF